MKTTDLSVLTESSYKKKRPRAILKDHPSEAQIDTLKSLLLRAGIAPTRSRVNGLKRLTKEQAHFKIQLLTNAAEAAESARATHPEGPRSTSLQLDDWHRWKVALNEDIEAPQLVYVVNLDTAGMQTEIFSLRSRFWKQRDFDGQTPQWRRDRHLFSEAEIQAGASHREQEHKRIMAEAVERRQREQEESLESVPDDMRDLLRQTSS